MTTQQVETVEYPDEMAEAFGEFGTFVNVGRALPDVRDGMSPVHRRILWAMLRMRSYPDRPRTKAAQTVGEVIGKYHPHGDAAVYDTMVGMAQPFKRRISLIDGHGNWGGLGISAAAYRYTECRLTPAAMAMLGSCPGIEGSPEIDEEAVKMMTSYNGVGKEPMVLPSMWPNFVINGNEGIGVGVATKTVSHNLGEVMDLAVRLVDSPNPTDDTVMKMMPGPDFPCDADIIKADNDIWTYFRTGANERGNGIVMRARYHVEEYEISKKKTGNYIIVTGLPYMVSPESVVAGIRSMVDAEKLPPDITVDNFTNKKGIRIRINVEEYSVDDILQRLLYHYNTSKLQATYSVYMNAVIDDEIRCVGVVEAIKSWIEHRKHVVRRRSQFRLKKAETRLHVVEGYLKAIPIAKEIVDLFQSSANKAEAITRMISTWGFSEVQASAVADMTISQITRLGVDKFLDEKNELNEIIEDCNKLLTDPSALEKQLKSEMRTVKKQFATPRRCNLRLGESPYVEAPVSPAIEIPAKTLYVAITGKRFVRRSERPTINRAIGNDHVTTMRQITDQNFFDVVSNLGYHMRMVTGDLPAKPTVADSLFNLAPHERLVLADSAAYIPTTTDLVMVTKHGMVKRFSEDMWTSHRVGREYGMIRFDEDDEVVQAFFLPEGQDILIATTYGNVLRLDPDNFAYKGPTAKGVGGISFTADNDRIIWAGSVPEGTRLVHWTEKDQVGWFNVNDVKRMSPRTMGQQFSLSENYIHGMIPAQGSTLSWFVSGSDAPNTVQLDPEQRSGLKLKDDQVKVVARKIHKVNAVWSDPDPIPSQ